jgi:hypothetical protein
MQDHEHPVRTRTSLYRYLFTAKHHGAGDRNAARWSPELTEDEEFSVFDSADAHQLADDRGWLYGVLQGGEGGLRDLGTWNQQVAQFPLADEAHPWHGYPLWAVSPDAPEKLRGEKYRPPRDVFDRMVAAALLSPSQRKRLLKGDHI